MLTGYAEGARAVARKTKTPLIDLHASSVALHNKLSEAKSAEFGPKGDRTHFNTKGAERITDLITGGFSTASPALSAYLIG